MADATNGSAPAVEWQSTYGAAGSDVGYNAVQTADGGYLVIGVTKSFGNGSYDAWLLKLDDQGRMVWNRTYGGSGGDWLYGIATATDGNFLLVGATNSMGAGGFDVWLVKVNGNGDAIWSRTYGSAYNDAGFSVAPLANGGCAVAGYRGVASGEADFLILRADADGNPVWERMYHHGVQDWCKAITATSDGGLAASGWTQAAIGSKAQAYLLKVDVNGDIQWGHAYGRTDGDSYSYGVMQTEDGDYLLSGHTNAIGVGGMEFYLVRTGKDGRTIWERAYGRSGDEYGYGIIPVADGYVMGGYSTSFDPALSKLYLIRINKTGSMLDAREYGPGNASVSAGLALHTADNGFLFVGNTDKYGSGKDDVYVMKLGGTPAAVPPAEDIVARAAVPVAAVVAGTGLSFLGLFLGRIFDSLSGIFNKLWDSLGDFRDALMKVPAINAVYKLLYGYLNTNLKSMVMGRMNKITVATAAERVPLLAGLYAVELGAIALSAVLFGLAYIIARRMNLFQLDNLVLYILIAGFVMSLHDLAHRYYARKFKSVAEYKIWGFGTLITFLTAFFFGVTYAVPARTIINGASKMDIKDQAVIFLSGPVISAILAIAFLLLVPFGGMLKTIGLLGGSMNLLSAVYSLTPFQPMDGNKVYRWKKGIWAVTFVPLLLLYLAITIFVQ
jgi:Zn-dependent protease